MPQPFNGSVFISYSRRDSEATRHIVAFLRDRGIPVWVDNEKLVPGTPIWEEEVENAITLASAIVVVMSPDAKTSAWVRREISLADQHRKRIFPVLVRGDEGSAISLRLTGRQYVDLQQNEEDGLNSLASTLSSYLRQQEPIDQHTETQPRLGSKQDLQARMSVEQAAAKPVKSVRGTNRVWLWILLGVLGMCFITAAVWGTSYLANMVNLSNTPTASDEPDITETLDSSLPVTTEVFTPAPTDQPTQLPTPSDTRRLSFTSLRDDPTPGIRTDGYNGEIYIMNADGSDQTRLTNSTFGESDSAWSPDGRKIAFVSDRNEPNPTACMDKCNYEIYVMDADGSNQVRLTSSLTVDFLLTWSPDGRFIAFVSDRDGNNEIYVMKADGSDQTRITNNDASDFYPRWSPDGQRILFISERDGNSEVYVMDTDGSNQIRLTNTEAFDYSPTWSPDGNYIAFSSDRDGNLEIYLMNEDGTNPTRLTNNNALDIGAAWSPDGKTIAFVSNRDDVNPSTCSESCNTEIYVMNVDGTEQTRLTNNSAAEWEPSWQPVQ